MTPHSPADLQIVPCARCGKDRWWVNDEVSPPFCKPCKDALDGKEHGE